MLAKTSMPGMDMAFPDVCKTPAPPPVVMVPIPYPNISMNPMAIPTTTSLKHLITFMPSHNMASTTATSMGDTTGVLGGVASQIMMGPGRNTKSSVKVITGAMPATRMLDTTMQNLTNSSGMSLVPSQFKVLYLG